MKFVIYNVNTGAALHYSELPGDEIPLLSEGCAYIEVEVYNYRDLLRTTVVDRQLVIAEASVVYASVADIKRKWLELEDVPLHSTKGVFEGDQRSLNRLAEAHKSFYDLPLVDGHLEWRGADNTYSHFTRDELGALLDELATLRAIRTNKLFRAYQTMLTIPNLTLSYVQNSDNWL